MIIKTMSRKSGNCGALINYVARYIVRQRDQDILQQKAGIDSQSKIVLRRNLRARTSVEKIIKEFEENEKWRITSRRKNSVLLYHTVISFSPLDRKFVTDKVLKEVAKKYIDLRGRDCLHLVVSHKEKEAIHMHAVCSGVKIDGYSSRLDKAAFRKLTMELTKFQMEKFPELVHSLPNHGRSKQLSREEIVEQAKASRQHDKATLVRQVGKIYEKSNTKEEFFSLLEKKGYELYSRGTEIKGVFFEGRKFRFNQSLGLDIDLLEQKKQQTEIDESLTRLQEIRKAKAHTIHRNEPIAVNAEKANELDTGQQQMLNELTAIRNQNEDRELELEQFGKQEISTERLRALFRDEEIVPTGQLNQALEIDGR